MYRLILLTLLFLVTFSPYRDLYAANAGTKPAAVKIGVIGSFTGPDGAVASSCLNGIKVALKELAHSGTQPRIELLEQDDRGESSLTLAAYNKLAAEKVSIVLMLSSSDVILANQKAFNERNIPILAVLASHPAIAGPDNVVSQVAMDDRTQAEIASLLAMDELLLNRAAVIFNDAQAHYAALAFSFIDKYHSLGGRIWTYQLLGNNTLESEQLQELVDNKVQFVYLAVEAQNAAKIAGQLKKLKTRPILMGSDGLLATVRLQNPAMIKNLNGIYFTDYFSTNIKNTPFGDHFIKRFYSEFRTPATILSGLGAEAAAIASNAIDRCGNGDPGCIKTMVRHTENIEGINGKLSIGSDGRTERVLLINKVRRGLPQFVLKIH